MKLSSVRVRLTLWNVLILAVTLGGFGAALCYSVQVNQSASIDRQLEQRVAGFANRGFPREGERFRPPFPGGFGGGGEFDRRDRRRGGGPFGERRGGPLNRPEGLRQPAVQDRPNPGSGPDPRPADERGGPRPDGPFRGDRNRFFQRPLLFGLDGKPGPMFPDDPAWDAAAVTAALKGRRSFTYAQVEDERLRVLTVPVQRDGVIEGALQVAHPTSEQRRLAESQLTTLFILLPLAVLAAGAGGLFLTNRALQPVREVTRTSAEISAEDLNQRLNVTGGDELAELSATFNGMIERLDESFRARAAQHRELEAAYRRLETAFAEQRRFTGDASHELRTPLTRIKGATSLALMGPPDAESYREALETADQAADAMTRVVQDLLLLARADAGQLVLKRRPCDAGELMKSVAMSFRSQPPPSVQSIPVEGPLPLLGDPDHLKRLLLNLVQNAHRHTPPEGRITLSAERDSDCVRLSVADTGEGIPAEALPRVFDRFFRVDAARTRSAGGTGLGLSICRSIAQAHGGEITLESAVGRGTTVRIELPLASPSPPTSRPSTRLLAPRSHGSDPTERDRRRISPG